MDEQGWTRGGQRDGGHRAGQAVAALSAQVETYIKAGLELHDVRRLGRESYHWDVAAAGKAEDEYRDFLWVCWTWWTSKHQEKIAGMGRHADQMWHCHMLLPRKYEMDCESIFGSGYILDHDPFFDDKVMPAAREEAKVAYDLAGRPFPGELIHTCQWSIIRQKGG